MDSDGQRLQSALSADNNHNKFVQAQVDGMSKTIDRLNKEIASLKESHD
jgi:hypothetical protein